MQVFKLKFFVLAIIFEVNMVSSDILPILVQNKTLMIYRALGQKLDECYKEELNPLIFVGNLSSQIKYILRNPEYIPIVIIDNDTVPQNKELYHGRTAKFIVNAGWISYLNQIFPILYSSIHWNINSEFFFVGTLNNSCDDAPKVLQLAWSRKLLKSLFTCYDHQINKVRYYTYNPFTDYATDTWEKIEKNKNSDERWTLYQHVYDTDSKHICKQLLFDETKYLNGYKLKVVSDTPNLASSVTSNGKSKEWGFLLLYEFTSSILQLLDVTPVYYLDKPEWSSTKLQSTEFLEKLKNGTYDIFFSARSASIPFEYRTRPIHYGTMVVVTKKRPFLTPTEIMLLFYEPYAVCWSILVMTITLIVLIMAKKMSWGPALLEIVRLIANAAMRTKKLPIPAKIYLFPVFWFLIIMIGTFQGNLASFLTKNSRQNVDTIEDLRSFKYHIYAAKYFTDTYKFLFSTINSYYLHPIDTYSCTNIVLENSNTACFNDVSFLSNAAEEYQLHISEPIVTDHHVFWTSKDFLFRRKFDALVNWYIESGLIKFLYVKVSDDVRRRLSQIESLETSKTYRPIKLPNLLFAFKILITGWIFSIIAFMFEKRSGYKKTQADKKRMQKQKKSRVFDTKK